MGGPKSHHKPQASSRWDLRMVLIVQVSQKEDQGRREMYSLRHSQEAEGADGSVVLSTHC